MDFSLVNAASVLFDATYIPGGEKSVATLRENARALHFVNETYKHCKAIAATKAGVGLLRASAIPFGDSATQDDPALLADEKANVGAVAKGFIQAIAQHRNWSREPHAMKVPA